MGGGKGGRRKAEGGKGGWIVVAVIGVLSAATAQADPTFAPGKSQGKVETKAIVEASGIAASRVNDRVVWIHNDSGSAAELFALSSDAKLLGTFRLPGITPVDTEDIAIGPGPLAGLDYIYLGDIGDNPASRKKIMVYRIPEPAVYLAWQAKPGKRELKGVQKIDLAYPDGAHNAETLMVDPTSGDLVVGTKEDNVTRFYVAAKAELDKSPAVQLKPLAAVKFSVASAGDISPTGLEILLRREEVAHLWKRTPGQSLAAALAGMPVKTPVIGPPTEPNGEAIGFDGTGSGYYTFSEELNQPLHYFQRTSSDAPRAPVAIVPAGAEWKYLDDGSDQGAKWREPGFDDASWASGAGQFGYGDEDEGTTIKFGSDEKKRHITSYFRRKFKLTNPARVDKMMLRLVYDDGAAVYLNGKEIRRVNLEPGAGAKSVATRSPAETEDSWFTWPVDKSLLVPGENTLAVEVHQRSGDSTDLSFDLQLLATPMK